MQEVKIGNLGMFADDESGYSPYQAEVFQVAYGTPKRGLATARLRATQGSFRINVSIVCPESEKRKDCLSLTRRESDDITKALHYLVETLTKHAFGDDPKVG